MRRDNLPRRAADRRRTHASRSALAGDRRARARPCRRSRSPVRCPLFVASVWSARHMQYAPGRSVLMRQNVDGGPRRPRFIPLRERLLRSHLLVALIGTTVIAGGVGAAIYARAATLQLTTHTDVLQTAAHDLVQQDQSA